MNENTRAEKVDLLADVLTAIAARALTTERARADAEREAERWRAAFVAVKERADNCAHEIEAKVSEIRALKAKLAQIEKPADKEENHE